MTTKRPTKRPVRRRHPVAPPLSRPILAGQGGQDNDAIPTDPRLLRKMLVKKVLAESPEILDALVDSAKTGNPQQAKYLFEFAGLAEPAPEAANTGDATALPLVQLLLTTLEDGPQQT